MMSGGPIRSFREGWAVALFQGRRAHFFARYDVTLVAVSACDIVAAVAALRGQGSYIRCKRCETAIKRHHRRRDMPLSRC